MKNIKNLLKKTNNTINLFENNIIVFNIKYDLYDNFFQDLQHYKLSIKLLLKDPNYYSVIRNVCINDPNEIEIWNSEHYDIINNYKKFDIFLKSMFKKMVSFGIISHIQFKLLKYIHNKIINVWDTDIIFKDINNKDKLNLPIENEIKFFFDMIEIIYYKFKNIKKYINDNDIYDNDIYTNDTNSFEILNDENYLKLITKIKKILSKNFYDNLLN